MIDQYTDAATERMLSGAPLNLAGRMREIRARQGLKQSEIARRMGVDPSIPSLWEQGKRPVPANRVAALAQALGVELSELVEGTPSISGPRLVPSVPARPNATDFRPNSQSLREPTRSVHPQSYLTLVQRTPESRVPPSGSEMSQSPGKTRWDSFHRPVLSNPVPSGWKVTDRVQDISADLPDGMWLDPVRLEQPAARQLLRERLCAEDRTHIEGQDVDGLVMAERLHLHCGKRDKFLTARVPLVESIFRAVVTSQYGGLSVEELVEALTELDTVVSVTPALLSRLRDSVRPYPLRWVHRNLFSE